MRFLRFYGMLSLLSFAFDGAATPVVPLVPQFGHTQHDLRPRILEEFVHNRWHLIMEELPNIFPPSENIAFWGLGVFLHTIQAKIAHDFQHSPPSRHYTISMGFLQLYAESTSDAPINWQSINWFVRRLQTFVKNKWAGDELMAWVTDEWIDQTVIISIRVLLDQPLGHLWRYRNKPYPWKNAKSTPRTTQPTATPKSGAKLLYSFALGEAMYSYWEFPTLKLPLIPLLKTPMLVHVADTRNSLIYQTLVMNPFKGFWCFFVESVGGREWLGEAPFVNLHYD